MRILVVTTSYPNGGQMSSGIFIKDLRDALVGAGAEVNVLVPVLAGIETPDEVHPCRISPWLFGNILHKNGGIPAALKANPLLVGLLPLLIFRLFFSVWGQRNNYQFFLANWSISGVVSVLACKKGKVVTVLRGSDVNLFGGSFLGKLFLRLIARRSRYVVCVSESLASHARSLVPARFGCKFVCVPNGIGQEFYDAAFQKSARQGVIGVGNLTTNKDYGTLVDAINFEPSLGAVSVDIVGDGPERPALEKKISALGLSEHIRLRGPLSRGQVVNNLAGATILVHPSLSEGRSNVVMEAMAAGLVVVASDIAANREVIQEDVTGFLFAPGDARALGRCLSRLIADEALCRKVAEAGRSALMKNGLTWESCASRYLQLLNDDQEHLCAG